MKKLLTCLLGVGCFLSSFGQGGPGIEAGLRFAPASSWLFNKNVSNQGNAENYAAAFSYNFGLDLAYDFSDKTAIEVNILLGTITQGYSGTFAQATYLYTVPDASSVQGIGAGQKYTSKNQLNATMIPVLFRFGSGNGAYVEIGPQYDMISSGTYSATWSGTGPYPIENTDVSSAFATSNIEGVLGFGDDFQIGTSGLNIITNLRFSYGFLDLKGTDALGQNMNTTINGVHNDALYTTPYGGTGQPYYPGYQATHSATASFTIGIYYFIGVGSNAGKSKHLVKSGS